MDLNTNSGKHVKKAKPDADVDAKIFDYFQDGKNTKQHPDCLDTCFWGGCSVVLVFGGDEVPGTAFALLMRRQAEAMARVLGAVTLLCGGFCCH